MPTLCDEALAHWAEQQLHDPVHIDCTTTVMLKILDGKCKMNEDDKQAIAILYDRIKSRPGKLLGDDIHALIAHARSGLDEALTMLIYEKRLLAETMLSRPVMKAYKAWLRGAGILQPPRNAED